MSLLLLFLVFFYSTVNSTEITRHYHEARSTSDCNISEKMDNMESLEDSAYIRVEEEGLTASYVIHFQQPLKSCAFISPQKKCYTLNYENVESVFMYSGSGLENGECGLKIPRLGQEYFGNWTSIATSNFTTNYKQFSIIDNKSLKSNNHYHHAEQLQNDPYAFKKYNDAGISAIAIDVILVIAALLIIAVCCYISRERYDLKTINFDNPVPRTSETTIELMNI